eukprot:7662731-Karenia_brevis.AAC.1
MGAISFQMSIFGCERLPTPTPFLRTSDENDAIYQSFSVNTLAKEMKRNHFTGAYHCFCEEKQFLYNKAIDPHAHGRSDEATS